MKNFYLFALIILIVSSCQNDDPFNDSTGTPKPVDPDPEYPEEVDPVQGSFTIWEDDFEDGDVSDWVFLDKDGNNSSWIARKNIQLDQSTGAVVEGTINILGTYNIDLSNGAPLGVMEENWATTAPIDLSYYSGKIELIINAQTSIYDGPQDLLVYGSTSPDPATFKPLATIHLKRETMFDAEFKDYTVDISEFVGKTQVYISLVNANVTFIGYEIDKIWITAGALLENGISKKAPKFKFIKK
ncbi:hypothetical protein [Flavobacterium sp. MDT1-60]|uniref:hypothetical protein n=1 Tax=Flavobacterium sp. MDT1-60 TaxID=1979344 RepID=UPI00177AF11C|nr:hypothetical protein [Flavobacterium sp. MDT1-60]QOG00692.1 hypothetical protein IHE43_12705 [Flavobacterium sp. MDT1-60]